MQTPVQNNGQASGGRQPLRFTHRLLLLQPRHDQLLDRLLHGGRLARHRGGARRLELRLLASQALSFQRIQARLLGLLDGAPLGFSLGCQLCGQTCRKTLR